VITRRSFLTNPPTSGPPLPIVLGRSTEYHRFSILITPLPLATALSIRVHHLAMSVAWSGASAALRRTAASRSHPGPSIPCRAFIFTKPFSHRRGPVQVAPKTAISVNGPGRTHTLRQLDSESGERLRPFQLTFLTLPQRQAQLAVSFFPHFSACHLSSSYSSSESAISSDNPVTDSSSIASTPLNSSASLTWRQH
jgi:hypothetical protein